MANLTEISKFSEMKSIQPYSTKDEYIYAMKEDLSEWFNSMYLTQISADNFIDKLENGVIICLHANNVTKEALKTFKFDQNDLNQAGVINIPADAITTHSNLNRVCLTPSGKSNWSGDYLLYKADARAQSFQSRDNISNFIKWCRYIAKVRECLMFETDDLILRKNEKNFILCLLEVARFGSKFGIQVPTIIRLEQEIEAEIEREIEKSIEIQHKKAFLNKIDTKHLERVHFENEQLTNNHLDNSSNKLDLSSENLNIDKQSSLDNFSFSNINQKKNNPDGNLDNSSLNDSSEIDQESNLNENSEFFIDSLENLNFTREKTEDYLENEFKNVKTNPKAKSLSRSYSSTSLSSNFSNSFNQNEHIENNSTFIALNETILDEENSILNHKKDRAVKNLDPFFQNESGIKQKFIENFNTFNQKNTINDSKAKNFTNNVNAIYDTIHKMNHSFKHAHLNGDFNLNISQTNLHNHVCSIADRCTCEKQFPVIKIGEGKYRIGNTKNIVFIRILRNHIMVRVGGGWDTLENYLNKHDPCRCVNIGTKSNDNILFTKNHSNCSSNILLTPVQNSSVNQTNPVNRVPSSICKNIFQKSQSKINCSSKKNCQSANCSVIKKELDFTDAKLVVERDTQGKHIIGKIIINQTQETANSNLLNKSSSNSGLNNCCSTSSKLLNDSENLEMNNLNRNMKIPLMQNENNDKNNSFTLCSENFSMKLIKSKIPTSNSLNSLNQNKMKNIINQIPPKSPKNIHKQQTSLISENNLTFVKNQPGIYKLNNHDLSSNPTTTGYNSLNDDSSSDFLEQIYINPNNKMKSRLIKKYDKKRAITEAIIDLEKLNQTENENADSNLNIQNTFINNSGNLKVTSSPKPPPRNKKKYRRSKTTEIGKFELICKNQKFESMLNQQQHEDSLDEYDYESSEGLQIKKEKLNDSLESINLTLNNDFRIEDDSLLFNNDNGISLSLSTTSSISNINEIDQENDCLNLSQRIARAQWDKTDQKIEYKSQLASPNNNVRDLTASNPFIGSNEKKNTMSSASSPQRDLNTTTKKTNNLNLVKEQLYEMKKTIDATINFRNVQSFKPICFTSRTTPRKIKKRSGERSVTTGLQLKESEAITNPCHKNNNKIDSNNLSNTVTCKNKSNTNTKPKYSPRIDLTSRHTSSSLHNLNNNSSNQTYRTRHDSTSHTFSNRYKNSTFIDNNDASFSSVNTIPAEFKENKAYELRKKSLLVNKIMTKNHQHDPIYSRSHPISTELTEQDMNTTFVDNLQNLIPDSTARKRLFAKKSEKKFDPNLSIGSNGSSSFSSNSVPTTTNFILKNKILASLPIINKQKIANTLNINSDRKKYLPVKIKQSSRSKSNNDLFYELERTNSAQDLIELINNCEPPVGDLTKYKVLLNECENYDPKIKKNKKKINSRKEMGNQKIDIEKLNCTYDNEANDSNSLNKTHHKRSKSLPSYECIPLNQQKINDLTFDDEFHEETYWQDIKTNF